MKGINSGILGYPLIIFAILGYFVYGSFEGLLAVILLYILMSICSILNVIPVIGWIAATSINWYLIIPWVFNFTGIEMSWLVGLIFGYELIAGLVITISVLILIITKIYE